MSQEGQDIAEIKQLIMLIVLWLLLNASGTFKKYSENRLPKTKFNSEQFSESRTTEMLKNTEVKKEI